ncbi:MAG: hypothetical protein ACKVHP_00445, partial [Verrucomicrobiales bacterium]
MNSLLMISLPLWRVTVPLVVIACASLQLTLAETAVTASPAQDKPAVKTIGDALLRVNITAQAYNFYQPWEKGKPV